MTLLHTDTLADHTMIIEGYIWFLAHILMMHYNIVKFIRA